MERWGLNGLNFEVDVATAAAAAASAQAMNGLAPDARIMLLHLPTIEDVKRKSSSCSCHWQKEDAP